MTPGSHSESVHFLYLCKAYIKLKKYCTIVTVSSIDVKKNFDGAVQSREFLKRSLNINLVQQRPLAAIYRQKAEDSCIDSNVSVVDNVMNGGYLAQSLDMVGNPPAPLGVHHLRNHVDSFQDQRGASWTSVGNMDVHGRTNAADMCMVNNGLSHGYVPANMIEHQQLVAAMKESQNKEGVTEDDLS